MSGNVGRRLVAVMRRRARKDTTASSPAWAAAYDTAKIGFYTKTGFDPVFFLGFSADQTPRIASFLSAQPPSQTLDSFLLGAGISATKDFPAGPLGGVIRCGHSTGTSSRVTVCAWADRSVLALLSERNARASDLALVALAFRVAAEH